MLLRQRMSAGSLVADGGIQKERDNPVQHPRLFYLSEQLDCIPESDILLHYSPVGRQGKRPTDCRNTLEVSTARLPCAFVNSDRHVQY